jgi:hypothetical protein
MKTATFYAVIAIVASFGLTAFGKPGCNGNGGGQSGNGPVDSLPPIDFFPPVDDLPEVLPPPTATRPVTSRESTAASSAPPAQITPLDSKAQIASKVPSAGVSLIPTPSIAISKPTESSTTKLDEPGLNPELAGLVGTWSTVSRYGDGELSTIEVRFDDSGWAEFTIPAADGKRSTSKRRVSIENKELKLGGPDEGSETFGKLIELDSRQLVLEQAGREVTFVRRST